MLALPSLARPALIGLVALALIALAGLGFWRGMAAIDRLVADAAKIARAERDAHWRAEVEKSNAAAERERADQAVRAASAAARAAEELNRLRADLDTLEKANAALPNRDACGLDRDRVRLLNPAR